VADEQFTVNEEVREGQVQYYLDAQNAVDPNAHIANVKDLEEFKAALADASKSLINLTADFTTTEKILVSRDDVTINGNNKTITFTGDETGWQGNYVLHVYNTTGVTIKDIKLTGGDAALLVNGSEVTLTGAIDVSGNEFGGIESSKGVGVEKDPKLTVTGATFTNTSEAYGLPTIWEDQIEGTVVVADEQFTVNEEVREGQVQYYLDAQNAVDPNAHIANVKDLEEFKAALADASKSLINLTADFTTTEKILVSRDDVTINGNNKTITFTGDETGWQGNYVLHVYNTTGVTIKDIKLTGGDAALLVNGSEVTLTGAIDVSGNEFGGIESSKGVGVEKDPKLTVTGATFTNTSEAYGLPTIWEDQIKERW
jgi:phage host-nuclease inhibitor protein Gam